MRRAVWVRPGACADAECVQGTVVVIPGASWGALHAACTEAARTDYVLVTTGSASSLAELEPERLVREAELGHWDLVGAWGPSAGDAADGDMGPPCAPPRARRWGRGRVRTGGA